MPRTALVIAAPLPASAPTARFSERASKLFSRSDVTWTVFASTRLRLPMVAYDSPISVKVESAPAIPTNRPPLEAVAS